MQISTKFCFLTDKIFVLFCSLRDIILSNGGNVSHSKGVQPMNVEENAEIIQKRIRELDGHLKTALRMVETALICPNPYHTPQAILPQDFTELVQSLKTDGLTSPLTVRSIGTMHKPLFQLISEEEKLRACIYAKITPVPCVIIDTEADELPYLEEIFLPRNFFEESDLLFEIFSKNKVPDAEIARYFGISMEDLYNRLSLHDFNQSDRKIILSANISPEHAIRLQKLDPRTKKEVYNAMLNGVHGRSAEDLIHSLSESKYQTRIYIKHAGLFYNSIDKAVATMNRSGIAVKCVREEKKTFTRLTITVPKRS